MFGDEVHEHFFAAAADRVDANLTIQTLDFLTRTTLRGRKKRRNKKRKKNNKGRIRWKKKKYSLDGMLRQLYVYVCGLFVCCVVLL